MTNPIPTAITDLRDLNLAAEDFDLLESGYDAIAGGEWRYERWIADYARRPSFKLAAQTDLDRFHNGDDTLLDWPSIFGQHACACGSTTFDLDADGLRCKCGATSTLPGVSA